MLNLNRFFQKLVNLNLLFIFVVGCQKQNNNSSSNDNFIKHNKNVVRIEIKNKGEICSGWIATPRLIITAAHCLINENPPYEMEEISNLQLGFPQIESKNSNDIELIKAHDDYPKNNTYPDIGFIKLKEGREFNKAEVIPIYTKTDKIKIDDKLIAFGFATNNFVNTYHLKPSKKDLKTNGLTEEAKKLICVKSTLIQGDSGGPLYYLLNGDLFIIGTLSSKGGCIAENSDTTFVNVEKFVNWIETESKLKLKLK